MAVTTVRSDALTPTTDLVQAGSVFNDPTRLLDAGSQGGQSTGTQGNGAHGGPGDGPCHTSSSHSDEHSGRPVPTFWNFAESDHGAGHGHRQFQMRHHA